jgi:hypothetical protein
MSGEQLAISGFLSEFLLNEKELAEVLEWDYRDEYGYAELGLDHYQLTLIARMRQMHIILGTPPESCWLWSKWDLNVDDIDNEYARRLNGEVVAVGHWEKTTDGENPIAYGRRVPPRETVIKGVDPEENKERLRKTAKGIKNKESREIVVKYLNHLQRNRDAKFNTLKNTANVLRRLANSMDQSLSKIEAGDLDHYLSDIWNNKKMTITIRSFHDSIVRNFYKHLESDEWNREIKYREDRRRWRDSKRQKGRPGRLAFTLKHLQFLMGTFDFEKNAQGRKTPKIRKIIKRPDPTSVRIRVNGNNSAFRVSNLTYLPFLDRKELPRKKRGGRHGTRDGRKRVKYYFPGNSPHLEWRLAKARHENVRLHKEEILRHIKLTNKKSIVPSPSGALSVFYLGLCQHEELIEELEPLTKEILNRINDYRRDLAKKQGMHNDPEDDIWDFDLEEVDKEYKRQLIESAMGKREERPRRPRIRLPFPLIIIRGDYPPHTYGSTVLD